MFIERWIATSFGRHGERCDSSILRAPILIFSIIVLTLSILYFIYHAENPKAPKAYCVSTTSLSAPSFDRTLQIVTIIDLFAMAGDFLVFLRSRKQMRRAVFLFRHFDSHVQLNIPKNETESHFTYLNNLFHGPQRQKNVLILPPLNVRKMKT
ncbi:hypothetical protein M3Y98_01180900 [Aphelenchoides besseyi]|nr:hypothetical protein M3Y98_01180900 [Aphelenchoides besseyi]